MGRWTKRTNEIVRVQDIWRNRYGKEMGLSKAEYMMAYYGEECRNWDKDKIFEKWDNLRKITKVITKIERTRNIIYEDVENQKLNDDKLENEIKFGERVFSGRLWFQPNKEIDAMKYKDKMDKISQSIKKSGNKVVENFALQQVGKITNSLEWRP